ncbi:hypothetical protein [Tropheryma whipplei]|nr:hypothetical protein [Tropheryma whipplei]
MAWLDRDVPHRNADPPKMEPRPLVMLSQKPLGDRMGAALLDL